MYKIKHFALIILAIGRLYSQNVSEAIQKNAVECKDPAAVNQNLYNLLKNYRFICLGEMHGTKEPAEFLTGLAKTFASNNKQVIIGFEIQDSLMASFYQQHDSSGLSKTAFFSGKTVDGRGSEAWFRAINTCNKLGVRFCFFDNTKANRDFVMYENILKCSRADTNAVFITLSGNIHNKIVPHNGSKTMGCYLKERFGKKVCSINYMNNGGTMFSKTADGLKIHQVAPGNSIFSTVTAYENYYLPNIFNIEDYNGFFYTKTMTASLPFAP
ncbi:MAG: hypothetical protein JST26_13290 [Bacteroidetes bacterium]|nr:hypothetical protein [Bacteroidota bacterium]